MPSLFQWLVGNSNSKRSPKALHNQDSDWSTSQDDYVSIDPYAQAAASRGDSGVSTFPPTRSNLANPYSTNSEIPPSPGVNTFQQFDVQTPRNLNPAAHPMASHSYYNSTQPSYPSVKQTFKRIQRTLSPTFPELLDTLNRPLPLVDLHNMLQALSTHNGLPVTLPSDVREYFDCHDGQDIFSISSTAIASNFGLLWGLWLMTADEIVAEWEMLRKMEARMHSTGNTAIVDDPFAPYYRQAQKQTTNSQTSCPQGWVQPVFSSPAWIPLARDNAGNYIGIDLDPPRHRQSASRSSTPNFDTPNSPGPSMRRSQSSNLSGLPGQVIAFGREIDTKTVLYPGYASGDPSNPAETSCGGWARFLSAFADDLENGEFGSLGGRHSEAAPRSPYQSEQRPSHNRTESNDDAASLRTQSSDGIGSLGYFEGTLHGAYSVGNADDPSNRPTRVKRGGTTSDGWKLNRRYKNMGVVEALCRQSQSRWQELGIEATPQVLSTSARSSPKPSSHRPAPLSPANRSLSDDLMPTTSDHGKDEQEEGLPPLPASPQLVFSPASPSQSQLSSAKSPRLSTESQGSQNSTNEKGKGRVSFDSNLAESRQNKRRSNLPPPMSVALPTLADLALDELDPDKDMV